VFWKALPPLPGSAPDHEATDLTGMTIATSLVSLSNPVLPKNLQFAVVDRAGRVLFHSDASRTMAENIFQESENNPTLKSLVASRDSDTFTGRYLGRAYRFHVRPLDVKALGGARWSLLVFQPTSVAEATNLGTLMLSISMFVVYALALAVIWGIVGFFWPDAVKRFLWPSRAKGPLYRRAATIGTGVGLICIGALTPGMSVEERPSCTDSSHQPAGATRGDLHAKRSGLAGLLCERPFCGLQRAGNVVGCRRPLHGRRTGFSSRIRPHSVARVLEACLLAVQRRRRRPLDDAGIQPQ